MEITKIQFQKRRRNRVNIYIDDEFALGIDESILIKYNLKKGMKLDEDFIDNIILAEEENKNLNYALKLLSYRQRSEKEMLDALERRGCMDEHIVNIIEYLKGMNYLNDKEFAQSFANDKINLNKHGPYRIKHELRLKGVSKDIIDKVVDFERNDEYELAKEVADKRIYSYRNDDKRDIYRKMHAYLQRRGFSYDIISKVIRETLGEMDNEEDFNE